MSDYYKFNKEKLAEVGGNVNFVLLVRKNTHRSLAEERELSNPVNPPDNIDSRSTIDFRYYLK